LSSIDVHDGAGHFGAAVSAPPFGAAVSALNVSALAHFRTGRLYAAAAAVTTLHSDTNNTSGS